MHCIVAITKRLLCPCIYFTNRCNKSKKVHTLTPSAPPLEEFTS